MGRTRVLRRLAIVSCFVLLALMNGCGDNTPYEGAEQTTSANQQAARAAAYGNPSNPGARGRGGKPALTGEAAARQRAGR